MITLIILYGKFVWQPFYLKTVAGTGTCENETFS